MMKGRTDRIATLLAEETERWRPVLDYNHDLSQVHFIVQFRPDGEIRKVIVKPEGHREMGPQKNS